jgi:hypothetical protein
MYKIVLLLMYFPISSFSQNAAMPGQNTDSLKTEMAKQKAENKKTAAKTHFQYFVIKAENNTYGYDIYADGNIYIHQSSIPAVGGNNGFSDTAAAGYTARFAIKKIKQGELPPTITVDELKKLHVIK